MIATSTRSRSFYGLASSKISVVITLLACNNEFVLYEKIDKRL